MPDKPITVLTYAASASLAAVALVYFFNPNYIIDGDSSSSASSRKKGVVGLLNPANDCFINCVLQSLAGLGDLRLYLIREVHRRELGPDVIYESVPLKDSQGKEVDAEKMRSLQGGEVTQGLKEMIDRLNERPIYKKTISAANFIRVLESAFKTRIAKSQQDAQELLQIVAERLSEEYQAGKQARRRAKRIGQGFNTETDEPTEGLDTARINTTLEQDLSFNSRSSVSSGPIRLRDEARDDGEPEEEEDGFPLEGKIEAKTECQYCRFIPKVKPTSFVMLTLTVPQKSSSTLNECFDAQFKTEYIDDYKCDKCRLEHAAEVRKRALLTTKSTEMKGLIEKEIEQLQRAIEEDPEKVPKGVTLPDSKFAPKRKIGRYAEITKFPKIMIIHLSRSIFDPRNSSTKNLSKLSFPECFPVGGLLNRKRYKLLGMASHKGTHNSGHYETFRRQHVYTPFSNPHRDRASGPYSLTTTPVPSGPATPKRPTQSPAQTHDAVPILIDSAIPEESSVSVQSLSSSPRSPKTPPSTRPSSGATDERAEIHIPKMPASPTSLKSPTTTNGAPRTSSSIFATSHKDGGLLPEVGRLKRKKRSVDRWWRISDDKIKECKTNDVLAMQKEVYLLFYEMEKD